MDIGKIKRDADDQLLTFENGRSASKASPERESGSRSDGGLLLLLLLLLSEEIGKDGGSGGRDS